MPSKILVVDDNKSIVEVLKIDFEMRGHKVFVAYDGEEAEISVKENQPNLIILDVMMPKKNGYAVCRDLKKEVETSKIPIILLTAKNTKDDIYWGYDSGADAYVTKPYEPRDLIDLVDQLLKASREGRRSVAWTGLPDGSVVEKEASLRLDAGGDAVLINMDFDDTEKETFVQKYGTSNFRELIYNLAWKLHGNLQEVAPVAIIGQYADDNFLILSHSSEVDKVEKRLLAVSESLVKSSYDGRDQEAGGIAVRDHESGKEAVVPIMAFKWKVSPPK
jgi:twitching motility two-component system response regulator PilH